MKKIFGEINLTWKKLIIFAIIAGVYTAVMAMIPITKETSFRDIAIQFEWWILFGIIIICNSKSPKDSALKCFIFFLISQPLVYLIQVPFSSQGWRLFSYYKYWFIWTLLCLPMGFIGYFIKKKNLISLIILLPMLILLAYLGVGYLDAAIENFPHHLLSCILCFVFIIIIIFNIFDKWKYRILAIMIPTIVMVAFVIINGGLVNNGFETYRSTNDFDIKLEDDAYVSYWSGTKKGEVTLIPQDDKSYNMKLSGKKKGEYKFCLSDKKEIEYCFEYHFDKDNNTVELNRTDK